MSRARVARGAVDSPTQLSLEFLTVARISLTAGEADDHLILLSYCQLVIEANDNLKSLLGRHTPMVWMTY